MPLLEVENVVKHYCSGGFFLKKILVRAVDGVSLFLREGETLGLVGESGCGKSTLARLIARLEEPDRGKIFFGGEEITALKGESLRKARRNIQLVFQNPFASLNPRLTVFSIVREPLLNYEAERKEKHREWIAEMLQMVGISPSRMDLYPHEFSGGERQRISIARALILRPKLLLLDEPVSSLDVSIQAQILNLLKRLKKELGLSYLFISHDLSVVRYISDRIAVMYFGKIVEILESSRLFSAKHPYTQALISAVPSPDPEKRKRKNALSVRNCDTSVSVSGCYFYPRCPFAKDKCSVEPQLVQVEKDHFVACFRGYKEAKGV